MDKTRITYLYDRYLNDRLTAPELSEFSAVLNNPDVATDLEEVIDADLRDLNLTRWPALTPQKLDQHFIGITSFAEKRNTLKLGSWRWISTAAAIAVMVFGVALFYFNRKSTQTEQTAYHNDVAPGKAGATLTLANGKKIRLTNASNGELANESGIAIRKTADGQIVYQMSGAKGSSDNKINTLSTANGETYLLTLPDKTQVWLNAASSLTYSAALNERGQRKVKLSGEAYFQVAKDKAHPFIVETPGQEVEVLGTHFNISSYADDANTKTTLLEGSVKVNGKGQALTLKPNQQAILSKSNPISVKEVDAQAAIDWKSGQFIFNDEPLESIMRKLSRWYNVDVVYAGADPKALFYGSMSRYDHISKVLSKIELTGGIHFKIEGRKILVTK